MVIDQDKKDDEYIELDDDYEDIFGDGDKVDDEVEDEASETHGKIGEGCINTEVEMKKEISLLKDMLEVAEIKHKQDENKNEELVLKLNSFIKAKDVQLEELEQSVACLEDMRFEQIDLLEKKLKIAHELFEQIKDIDIADRKDVECILENNEKTLETECLIKKDLEAKIFQMAEKLKQKDDEKLVLKMLVDDSKHEKNKLSQDKKSLDAVLLDIKNKSEDLEKEISSMKEKAIKEKDEDRVKILGLEKTLQRLKENNLAKLDNLKKDMEEMSAQNSKFQGEIGSLKQLNTQMKKKLQKIKDEDVNLPMIKSVKFDRSKEEISVGAGSFGSISKVSVDGRSIAIKKAEIGQESISEALIMSKINHPHVVSALGVSIQHKDLLISMECLMKILPFI